MLIPHQSGSKQGSGDQLHIGHECTSQKDCGDDDDYTCVSGQCIVLGGPLKGPKQGSGAQYR